MTETFSPTTGTSDSEKDEDLESDDEEASPLPTSPDRARGSLDETDQIEQLQVTP